MPTNYTVVPKYIIFFIFLFVIAGCNNGKSDTKRQCSESRNECLTLSKSSIDILMATDKIFVETMYPIKINSKHEIEKVIVQGVSMAMGNVPIRLEQLPNGKYSYNANLMLGMCAQPKMEWQFVIETSQGEIINIPFTSYWPEPKD